MIFKLTFNGMSSLIKGGVMRKIIICIFLVLTFICSCSEKSEKEKAAGNLNDAIKLQPNRAENYNKRGEFYYKQGQNQRAFDDFNKAISLKQDYATAYNNRGSVYYKQGQNQRAFDDFNKAISLKQDYATAYSNRGTAYILQGKKKLGCNDVKKGCELGDCKILEEAKDKGLCR